jgi:hypothetical protein
MIKRMACDKATGQSKLTTDTTILNTIYKSKGDPQDPNNHRGITLKETSAKVLNIVVAQKLLKRSKQINPTSQFRHIGCQEAQHIIKKALLL